MNAKELTTLRHTRGGHKGYLTRFKNYYDSLDLTSITDIQIEKLKIQLTHLEKTFTAFVEIQDAIELAVATDKNTKPEETDKEADERRTFENDYFELYSLVTQAIKYYERALQEKACNSAAPTNSSYDSASVSLSQTRLPIIQLPTFNGAFDKWLEFKDAFMCLVDENASLSAIQKFYYLRSSLEGEASDVINSVEVSALNYPIAWALLKEMYDDNRLLIHHYVKALFDAPSASKESYIELKKLYTLFIKNVRSLQALGQPTDSWDTLLIYLLTTKLDTRTKRDWEAFKCVSNIPTMTDMNTFLKEKCKLLEKLESDKCDNRQQHVTHGNKFGNRNNRNFTTNAFVTTPGNVFTCYYCKLNHTIFKCDNFLKLDVDRRNNEVRRLKLCINCLSPNHSIQSCDKRSCKKCNGRHNSLLHRNYSSVHVATQQVSTSDGMALPNMSRGEQQSAIATRMSVDDDRHHNNRQTQEFSSVQALHSASNSYNTVALLSTALVTVENAEGNKCVARALLDQGSQSNFITDKLCKRLGLNKEFINLTIKGIGETSSMAAKCKTRMKLLSNVNNYNKEVSCLVLDKITQALPVLSFNSRLIDIPIGIELADPNFNIKGDIDILLGVGLFYDVLLPDQIKRDKIAFHKTQLGWIVGGEFHPVIPNNNNDKVTSCLAVDDVINENLIKFWQLEECDNFPKSDDFCERHFKQNYRRDSKGRFIVNIPFKDNASELGNSREMALRRFNYLERRLSRNDDLKKQYCDFMSEYERLKHMTELPPSVWQTETTDVYYLPHHAVLKDTSLTTKLRVVFDASAKTDTQLSLNDVQHAGPTIQDDLFAILLRFRKHRYVLSSDISKMYRQVLIAPEQRRFQRIFWRASPGEDLKCYELNTVTYGTASAPFLAVRALQQTALDSKDNFPLASNTILKDFYVDDLLTGCDSETELLQIQREVSSILASAGFDLRKWISNKTELHDKFYLSDDLENSILDLSKNEQCKTLGIFWNARSDMIQYHIRNVNDIDKITKRGILSTTSQIFDPLGLLGPVVIVAKLILQTLWNEKLTWDQEVSPELKKMWLSFCSQLSILNQVRIPRYVFHQNSTRLELHAFADASEKAYGACVFIRSAVTNTYTCKLLCAKSRVAPIKRVTLPRLELCAAVLASSLVHKVKNSINYKFDRCYYWSDSTITLCWIRGSPDKWKTFVANRVGKIQTLTDVKDWFHVRSEDNPADCLSRGISTDALLKNELWWTGPQFLRFDGHLWPNQKINIEEISDIPETVVVNVTVYNNDFDIFSKYSSLTRLCRIIAHCFRFTDKARNPGKTGNTGPLQTTELNRAMLSLTKIAQIQSFTRDYNDLITKRDISNTSNILSLKPFLDKNYIIRVGGRLRNANINYDKKHPILLHHKHPFTKLIMTREHIRLLHCGPQQLLYSVRDRYWPLSGRNLARLIVRTCVTCFKAKPSVCEYLMGDLPETRINKYLPFINTGCDYAGPFLLKDRKTRAPKMIKSYVCIFICMSTKAIHLELVTDLTSDAFLACFRRFVSRRGRPSHLFSDNAKTFVGANAEFKKLFKHNHSKFATYFSDEGVIWHFIPPRAPNFGGLWEAGVKSIKYHLKRTIGNTNLHYDDFMTILTQIEGVLNSRPLCPLSSSPDDFIPLTPSHFLIGRTITAFPDPNITQVPDNRLKHYKFLQKLLQDFWHRWSQEYITELQTRIKWKKTASQRLKIGDLVLVKDDNAPPLYWKTARVTDLHPGEDGITRVASIKFPDGAALRRALTKLCILPLEDMNDNSKGVETDTISRRAACSVSTTI